MSFSEEQLQNHCKIIMQSRRIQGKIVILCEGGNTDVLTQRPSPSAYRQLEKLPDASFYKACVPQWWQTARPEFFNCGDKENVLQTYFKLHEMHENERNDSYLNKDKLFAIIDLDLQPAKILNNYPINNTEELFKTLYQKNELQADKIMPHSIFITGLIYKEAYFLVPDLQTVFDNFSMTAHFNNEVLQLEKLYLLMINSLIDDKNLGANFLQACNRINYIEPLDTTDINSLQQSCLQLFNRANAIERNQLIHALLSIHQVKDNYWKIIKLENTEFLEQRFKEQLILAIGQFYSKQPQNSPHHFPKFFQHLSQHN